MENQNYGDVDEEDDNIYEEVTVERVEDGVATNVPAVSLERDRDHQSSAKFGIYVSSGVQLEEEKGSENEYTEKVHSYVNVNTRSEQGTPEGMVGQAEQGKLMTAEQNRSMLGMDMPWTPTPEWDGYSTEFLNITLVSKEFENKVINAVSTVEAEQREGAERLEFLNSTPEQKEGAERLEFLNSTLRSKEFENTVRNAISTVDAEQREGAERLEKVLENLEEHMRAEMAETSEIYKSVRRLYEDTPRRSPRLMEVEEEKKKEKRGVEKRRRLYEDTPRRSERIAESRTAKKMEKGGPEKRKA